MIDVPLTAMLTIDRVPKSFIDLLPNGISTHAILAAFLTCGSADTLMNLDPWRRVWPSRRDFEESLPVFWPENLRGSCSHFHETCGETLTTLPPSASGLWTSVRKSSSGYSGRGSQYEGRYQNILCQQEKRLRIAWERVLSVFPDIDWGVFSYNWIVLNTRSFYYVSPSEEEPEDWNDAIALVPFADYLNHADNAVRGCPFRFHNLPLTYFEAMLGHF